MSTPQYDSPQQSNESGSGTPEQAANQPAGQQPVEQVGGSSEIVSAPAGTRDPQAASPARITREAEVGGDGVVGLGATTAEQSADPAAAPVGAAAADLGVADASGGVPVDPGRKAGAANNTELVGAQRRHAPDGEVGPS